MEMDLSPVEAYLTLVQILCCVHIDYCDAQHPAHTKSKIITYHCHLLVEVAK